MTVSGAPAPTPSPSPAELRARVEGYVAAVNGRDPDALAALFAEDALQADPASAPPNVGRDAIRAFFAASIGASRAWTFTAGRVHTCADHAAIDFRIEIDLDGAVTTIAGIEVFTFEPGGLIRSVHAYWDDADVTVS